MRPKEKSDLYKNTVKDQSDLFIIVQSGNRTLSVVPLEKREKFREYLQETTFKIDKKIIKIGDITFHDEKKKKTKTTSNQIMPNNGSNEM